MTLTSDDERQIESFDHFPENPKAGDLGYEDSSVPVTMANGYVGFGNGDHGMSINEDSVVMNIEEMR